VKRSYIALVATLLLAASCGAVQDEPDLAAVVASTEAKESWRMEMYGLAEENETLHPARCSGAADHARRRLELTCSFGRDELEFAIRMIGDDVYIMDDESEPKWAKQPAGGEDPLAEIAPDRLLSLLRGASVASEYGGEETVRTVSATRYRLTVDCEEAELTDCKGGKAPVDVWIAADDTVRRISLEDGGQSITIEFFDFGVDVDVEPPPADQVAKLEDLLAPLRCAEDGGSPIRVSRAVDALRERGFSVRAKETGCFSGLAGVLDNTGTRGVLGREGLLSCHVYDKPKSTTTRKVVRRGVDGGDAELVLANLECMIFTDRPDPEERIDRLEQAFAELEREIRR
jgi:hypothetical protein